MAELLVADDWVDPGPLPATFAGTIERGGFNLETVREIAGGLVAVGEEPKTAYMRAMVLSRGQSS